MKYLFAIFLLSISAHAQKKYLNAAKKAVGRATGAQISELHYFPSQWDFNLTLGYRQTNSKVMAKTNGTVILEYDRDISTALSTLQLGLLDSLYVQIDADYLMAADTSYNKPANTPSEKDTGANDPILSGVYRVLDGSIVKLDGKIFYQPSLGVHHKADAQNTGDARSGGEEYGLGLRAVALVTNTSQLSLTVDYKIGSEQTSVDQTTSVESIASTHNTLELALLVQSEITADVFFGAGFEIFNVDAYDIENQASLAKTTIGSTSTNSLAFLLGYELTPDDAFQAEFNYLMDYNSDINGADLNVEASSGAVAYTHRF
jgi:hypothetical protein